MYFLHDWTTRTWTRNIFRLSGIHTSVRFWFYLCSFGIVTSIVRHHDTWSSNHSIIRHVLTVCLLFNANSNHNKYQTLKPVLTLVLFQLPSKSKTRKIKVKYVRHKEDGTSETSTSTSSTSKPTPENNKQINEPGLKINLINYVTHILINPIPFHYRAEIAILRWMLKGPGLIFIGPPSIGSSM